VPGVFFGHALSLKYMAKVAFAIRAHNFHSFHPKRNVGMAGDCARYLVIEGGPATATVKLVGGIVKRRIAAATNEMPLCFEVVVLACKSAFSAFLGNYVFFFGRQGIPVLSVVFHIFC